MIVSTIKNNVHITITAHLLNMQLHFQIMQLNNLLNNPFNIVVKSLLQEHLTPFEKYKSTKK